MIDNVSLFLVTIEGWRTSDEGRYVQAFGGNDGFAEIVSVTDASTAVGVIWDAFENNTTPSGEWFTLIKAFSVTRGFSVMVVTRNLPSAISSRPSASLSYPVNPKPARSAPQGHQTVRNNAPVLELDD